MTNYEFLQSLTIEELADYLCFLTDEACTTANCVCPFEKYCEEHKSGHSVRFWLAEEHIVDKETGW